VSATGDWLYGVALVVSIQAATGSSAWVAATTLVRMLPFVLFSTLGGVVADRLDRRRVMIGADLARGFLMLGLTALAFSDAPPVPMLLLAAGSTTFSAVYMPCAIASTPSLVSEDDLTASNALLTTIDYVAVALGPAVGGVLLLLGTPVVAFGVNAATFFLSAVLTVPIRRRMRPESEEELVSGDPESVWERTRKGFRAIGSSVDAVVVVVISVATTFLYGQEIVLYARAATDLLGIGESGISFMFAAVGVGGVLAAVVVGRLTGGPRQGRLLLVSGVVSALPMIAIAFVRGPATAYALLLVEGAAVLIGDVVSVTLLQRLLPREVLGRVLGIFNTVLVAGILAGSALAAVLMRGVGLQAAMVFAGLSLVVPAILAIPRVGALDRRASRRLSELEPRLHVLRDSNMFSAATPATLEALAAAATEVRVENGAVVIRQGDAADAVFVVTSGRLGVASTSGRGTVELGELHAGDHFGEIGLLEGVPRTATVMALSDCDLYRIDGDDFLGVVNADARLPGALGAVVAHRLRRSGGLRATSES
jgi:CRP-like cAMP-binding protein/predicted MFS family arabinose efflux permease